MLLEHLAEEAGHPPAYDWEGYYRWLFSTLAGREVTAYGFWQCRSCLTTNFADLPAGYGTCRACRLVHLPES